MNVAEAIIASQVRHWDEIFDWAGRWVRHLITHDHDPVNAQVLDVGAGHGKYRALLPEYSHVDACEIWKPTVDAERLRDLYRTVYVADVYDLVHHPAWSGEPRYDVVIFGDVLEHLDVGYAQATLERVYERCNDVIVVVPYLYEQGPEDDNEYQRHLQDDLTPDVMLVRYPDLQLIALETRDDGRPFKGLYRRYV